MRPVLLDLFCGAGGCAVGYYRAGFDIVGWDIEPHPGYPFEFHQGDALAAPPEPAPAHRVRRQPQPTPRGEHVIITDLPSVRPETIAAARRCITRQATRAGWTPADITDVHTILGIDEPALPTLAVEPAQQPEPAIPQPNPAPEPVAPVWFDALDVIAESGSTRNFVDYLVKSGHLIVAAYRTPSGTIAPAHGRGHGTRLFTRGEVAIACRIAHLNTAWRRSGAGMTLSDLTQIARAGHASDLPLGLLRSVDWLTVAAKARDAAATRPGWIIWREALLDLSVRALTVHVDTTPGEGSAE